MDEAITGVFYAAHNSLESQRSVVGKTRSSNFTRRFPVCRHRWQHPVRRTQPANLLAKPISPLIQLRDVVNLTPDSAPGRRHTKGNNRADTPHQQHEAHSPKQTANHGSHSAQTQYNCPQNRIVIIGCFPYRMPSSERIASAGIRKIVPSFNLWGLGSWSRFIR